MLTFVALTPISLNSRSCVFRSRLSSICIRLSFVLHPPYYVRQCNIFCYHKISKIQAHCVSVR